MKEIIFNKATILLLFVFGISPVLKANLTYSFDDINNTATITGFEGEDPSGVLTIPYSVENNGSEYIVNTIGWKVFAGKTWIVSVDMSACTGLKEIVAEAFLGCSSLESIDLSKCTSLTTIGNATFSWCTKLKEIQLPKSLETFGINVLEKSIITSLNLSECTSMLVLGDKAIMGCAELVSVSLPNSLTSIGAEAFSWCVKLETINFPATLTSIGAEAFNKTKLTSIDLSSCTSMTVIGEKALFSCNYLSNVKLPPTLLSIGNYAFQWNNSLTTIVFPTTLDTIGNTSFGSSGLTSVSLPASVSLIGDYAFSACKELQVADFSQCALLTSTGENTFSSCSNLNSILRPPNVEVIGAGSFGATGLVAIELPSTVNTIEGWAFYNCTSLNTITYNGITEPNISTDNNFGNGHADRKLYLPNVEFGFDYTKWGLTGEDKILYKDTPTNVSDIISSTIKVYGIDGLIVIDGAEIGSPYAISNISGINKTGTISNSRIEISTQAGIYIVTINNKRFKIIVR